MISCDVIKKIIPEAICVGNWQAKSVVIHSKKVVSHSLFIPLQGLHCNGHDYILDAISRGASAVLCDNYDIVITCGAYVPDTFLALQGIASYFRSMFYGDVIGITGSSGKTSCKDLLYRIFSNFTPCYATYESYNGKIGLPLTLSNLTNKFSHAFIEMGIDYPKSMYSLRKLSKPSVCILTSVSRSHCKYFHNLHHILMEKCMIFSSQCHFACISGDEWYSARVADYLTRRCIPYMTYGNDSSCDVYIKNTTFHNKGISVSYRVSGGFYHISMDSWSLAPVRNYAIVLCMLKYYSLLPYAEDISCVTSHSCNRGNYIVSKSYHIINDTFNANPCSMHLALEALLRMPYSYKVAIIGSMLELGSMSSFLHISLSKRLIFCDDIFLFGKECLPLYRYLSWYKKRYKKPYNVFYSVCRNHISQLIEQNTRENSAVLIKGSRRMLCEDFIRLFTNSF